MGKIIFQPPEVIQPGNMVSLYENPCKGKFRSVQINKSAVVILCFEALLLGSAKLSVKMFDSSR